MPHTAETYSQTIYFWLKLFHIIVVIFPVEDLLYFYYNSHRAAAAAIIIITQQEKQINAEKDWKRERNMMGAPFPAAKKIFYYKELWEIELLFFFSLSDLSGCATSDPVPSITTVKTWSHILDMVETLYSFWRIKNIREREIIDRREESGWERKAKHSEFHRIRRHDRTEVSIQPLHVLQ